MQSLRLVQSPKASAKAKAGAKPKASAKAKAGAKPKASAKPKPAAKAKADAKPKTKGKNKAEVDGEGMALEEPAPKRRPAAGRTKHHISIDDIVEPTPASWKADPAPPAPVPKKKRMARTKKSALEERAAANQLAKEPADQPKITWGPVSKEGAEAFQKNLSPLQEADAGAEPSASADGRGSA